MVYFVVQMKNTMAHLHVEWNDGRIMMMAMMDAVVVALFFIFFFVHLSFIFGDECGFGEERNPSPTRGEP